MVDYVAVAIIVAVEQAMGRLEWTMNLTWVGNSSLTSVPEMVLKA